MRPFLIPLHLGSHVLFSGVIWDTNAYIMHASHMSKLVDLSLQSEEHRNKQTTKKNNHTQNTCYVPVFIFMTVAVELVEQRKKAMNHVIACVMQHYLSVLRVMNRTNPSMLYLIFSQHQPHTITLLTNVNIPWRSGNVRRLFSIFLCEVVSDCKF